MSCSSGIIRYSTLHLRRRNRVMQVLMEQRWLRFVAMRHPESHDVRLLQLRDDTLNAVGRWRVARCHSMQMAQRCTAHMDALVNRQLSQPVWPRMLTLSAPPQ